ncbi:tripartite tricarboxylate transporter substrate binding protein [Oceanispirochaeta sp.]|jgi:tripartite-type tricarboxylate transporter receptor subunit TctC|uniref:tripartite tricarboxylate transporter substrate binding protein n=1 Tax=Oceanispirochaeta sp. TaxID=2035350 RepID=UPI00262FBA94|nr:tripartite tricarboxylate transporter substrate binding protein [Oceanispirochaeta sp.]MDA3956084.1 tripartite tricarboxylate transporter substrate binding protein [Oceanispirochaeta sp.]
MKKLFVLVLCMAAMTGMVFAEGSGEYPERDITNVMVWGAGGGTDTCNRVVMPEMAKELGVNINVVNNPGGVAGSVGMAAAFAKDPDGYTICGLSESCVTSAVMGGFPERMNVWDFFIIGGSPDIVSVTPDAPYNSIEELVKAAKANPGSIRAGASGAGSIHHLNLLAFEKGAGVEFNFIPYDGSAPAQNAAMTGEITLVITSVAEQAQLIRGGKLRPLGMLVPEAFELGDTKIPSAFDAYPSMSEFLPISQAIGFAIRKDADKKIKSKLTNAFQVAMNSEAVIEFGKKNYYILSGKSGAEANKVFDSLESNFGWTLQELGAAKVDPASLGIPKP